jgi:ADP-ribose pyrophosphatase YjhB (NUDIX family)
VTGRRSTEAVDRPHIYVGAYALCVNDQKLLLARIAPAYPDAGKWTLPGGGVNWGEAPDMAAVRELWEETGLRSTAIRPAGIFSATYLRGPERDRDSVHHIGIVYEIDVVEGALCDEEHGSTDRCGWIALHQVDALPLTALARYGRELVSH